VREGLPRARAMLDTCLARSIISDLTGHELLDFLGGLNQRAVKPEQRNALQERFEPRSRLAAEAGASTAPE